MKKTIETTSDNTDLPSAPLANSKHEIFAQKLAGGMYLGDAYLAAYPGTKRNSAAANANRLLKNAVVRARVEALKARNAETEGMTREEKRRILQRIANDPKVLANYPNAAIQAIAEDNRMTGETDDKGAAPAAFVFNLGGLLDG